MKELFNELLGDHFYIILIRVLVALFLSGLIGFERELKNHSAGFRTHILVGVGSCLMMLLSLFGFEFFLEEYDNIRFDPARIPSYVISGIGFLGAGTIIVYGGTIRGLTTAASIWTVAGLGLVVGAGMYAAAVLTTAIILLSLIFLNNFERLFRRGKSSHVIQIVTVPDLPVHEVVAVFDKYHMAIKKVEISKSENNHRNIYIVIERNTDLDRIALFAEISQINHVRSVTELT
ncbi:methyltransferase [Virgibacillus pantothenticus]|uniref:ATPase n=1 Tax=Virgibacillus pantothenticus TaxID=1473 RepID=A0A0L0QVW3_VIRPA|nr:MULTISPECIES: MgtC/SapB family protein [Virgibacillus]API92344.1 ATPase [Virgibacillus sp. 6R]KNE22709.1 ATPase [Virgibacillus pantothenticus]MEB5453417.1 MgtC/SapB family protein [Virgibacillus pantothenticus]MEB5457553.1 MgtC/SapB family protein [Virgibacillus pantothenticus]MEB5461627.1 MgtC/SapB family protein [Virgibacillus pantothenticus]